MQNTEPGVLVCPSVIGICPPPISDQFMCKTRWTIDLVAGLFVGRCFVLFFVHQQDNVLLAVNQITLFARFIYSRPYNLPASTNEVPHLKK